MARAVLKAGNSLKRKYPKSDKKIVALLVLNLLTTTLVACKLFGVI